MSQQQPVHLLIKLLFSNAFNETQPSLIFSINLHISHALIYYECLHWNNYQNCHQIELGYRQDDFGYTYVAAYVNFHEKNN